MARKALAAAARYNQTVLYLVTIAAIAVGTYLLLNALALSKVTAHLVPADRPQLFATGETITFGLTNHGRKGVTLSNSAPWRVERNQGNPVFQPVTFQATSELAPGETRHWVWDQRDQAGSQVKPGSYQITVSYSIGDKDETTAVEFAVGERRLPWYKRLQNWLRNLPSRNLYR